MKITYKDNIRLSLNPQEFDKNSGKEILQYAVGGLLYMPASNTKIANKIISREYSFVKSMVLDLEDALGNDMVGYGKRNIVHILRELQDAIDSEVLDISSIPLIFIRVRQPSQINEVYKMLGSLISLVTGFNIPKFDKTNCIEYINDFMGIASKVQSLYNTKLYIMPIIESKHVMYRQLRMDNLIMINDSLRPMADNVLNIRVGGADMCSIIGVRRPITSTIYEIGPVADCLNDILNVFGRSYIVSGPVWEYFGKEPGEWSNGLRRELLEDKVNGFIGKTCIHPSQLPIVQESYIVERSDYLDAMSILGMNENVIGVKKGVQGSGNMRMNEVKTHVYWAKKVIGLSRVYGVRA